MMLSSPERAKFEYCVGGYINLGEAALDHAEVNRLHEAMEMLSAYLGPRGVDEQISRNAETTPFWEYEPG